MRNWRRPWNERIFIAKSIWRQYYCLLRQNLLSLIINFTVVPELQFQLPYYAFPKIRKKNVLTNFKKVWLFNNIEEINYVFMAVCLMLNISSMVRCGWSTWLIPHAIMVHNNFKFCSWLDWCNRLILCPNLNNKLKRCQKAEIIKHFNNPTHWL